MATFAFTGRTRGGEAVTGERMGDSMDAVAAALRREQIQVTRITPVATKAAVVPKLKARSVPAKNLAVFTRQFSVMIDAGLPLVQCLDILGNQEEHKYFQQVILQTRTDVEGGQSLADAMKRHPKVFDALYTNMIAAGEAGGILDVILQRLSTYIEKVVKLRNQVKSAMIYPAAVVTIACFVVYIILWKVIPVFEQLFAGVGGEMPFITVVVIGTSNFLGRNSIWMLPLLVVIGFLINRYHKTHRGRRVIDGLLLKVPVLGMLLRKIAVARFCQTLATLTSSGVPILDGLEITAKTSGNAIIEDAVMAVRKSVEEGRTLSEPLAETKVFPPMVVQMINVGEQTGALDQMLSKIAEFYEEEVDTAVAGLMKLIEPVLITVLGGIIGTIVAAMYLPLYSVLSQIG
jgi:type IV pilus assembly protein PilC